MADLRGFHGLGKTNIKMFFVDFGQGKLGQNNCALKGSFTFAKMSVIKQSDIIIELPHLLACWLPWVV
jgi:hypothetical protein